MKRHPFSPWPVHRLAALGLLIGSGLGLLAQAPARWLSHAVAVASQQRMLLLNPSGTVWHGSADWALSDGDASPSGASSARLPTRLQWRIGPDVDWSHASLGLQLTLSSACCTTTPLQLTVSPTWQGLRVRSNDLTSHWPAAWLIGLGAPWNTVQAQGQLQLRTHQLQWFQPWPGGGKNAALSGQLELQWQRFSTRLSTLKPLGNYRVVVTGGDTIQMALSTLEGSLHMQGRGEWLQGRWRFRGEAKANTDAEAALSNLLNVLGQRRGNVSFMELG